MKDIYLQIIYLLIIYVLFTFRYCIMIFWRVYCWIYDEMRIYNFLYVNYITFVLIPRKIIRYLSIECGLKQSSEMSSHKLQKTEVRGSTKASVCFRMYSLEKKLFTMTMISGEIQWNLWLVDISNSGHLQIADKN